MTSLPLAARAAAWSLIVSLPCLFALPRTADAGLLAGAAKRSIVPPFPTHMGGFFDRKETFQGVHDEVFARALVLDSGTTAVVLIGSDLTAVDAEMSRLIREEIEKETGIPPANVLVSCAHNHSAPSLYEPGRMKESETPVKEFFVKQFSGAAIEAFKNRVPARAGFRAGELIGATRNRQQGNDLVDPQVGVLRVEDKQNGKPIATLFNFTGHPVIIGSQNLLLSGEYPGAACRAVENLLGGVALFTQGAGDVTVNRSGDPFDEIERVGRTLAGEVIKTSGFIRPVDDLELAAASRTLHLPARDIPQLEDSQQAVERLQAELAAAKEKGRSSEFLRSIEQQLALQAANVRIARGIEEKTITLPANLDAEVQVIQVGDLVIVAVPGELFVEFALEMRSRTRQMVDKSMILAGYANGYVGYIVTPRAARTGGYEASVARVTSEAGRAMTETAMDLLASLSSR